MKIAHSNFKRMIGLVLTFVLVISSMAVALVSASAVTVSNDENLFDDLSQQSTVTLNFENSNTKTEALSANNPRYSSGLVSATDGSTTTARMYSMYNHGVDDADNSGAAGGVRWSGSKQSCGIMFAYDDIKVGASTTTDLADLYGYKLSPNTKYDISFKLKDSCSNSGISINLMGVANRTTTEGTVYYTLSAVDTVDAWTTYSTTFTTGSDLGDNIYLAFMVLGPTTDKTFTGNLDTVTITKSVTEDSANVITLNDNGKIYYAYPENLTALPDGENGPLNSAFLGWVDANGNAVTEVPAAGTTVYAKYPISTDIPDKVDSVYLSLFNTADKTLSADDVKNTLGIVSSSGSSHEVYSRDTTIADGTIQWVVKFTNSTNHSENLTYKSICFSSANVAGNGSKYAYILEPDTKYTVSYNVYHESGANISFDLAAASTTKASSGLVLDSNKPDSIIKAWTEYTREFTTPDAATLGDNKYLLFVINNPALEKNTSWLYGVTITKTAAGTAADCITFNDGEDVFYATPDALDALPDGVNTAEGEDFLGWYDAENNKVTEVPAAGTVLTAKYGSVSEPKIIAVSIRYESGEGDKYRSAGIRFRSRLDVESASKATEIGFIAAPTSFLNGMTLPEYANSEGNVAISAKVKGEGMTEIIYKPNIEDSGKVYNDYQLIISGLTREGVTENLLDTEISTAMYMIIDGKTVYTETVAYSYNDVIPMMNK